jgi:hypothetical protein
MKIYVGIIKHIMPSNIIGSNCKQRKTRSSGRRDETKNTLNIELNKAPFGTEPV